MLRVRLALWTLEIWMLISSGILPIPVRVSPDLLCDHNVIWLAYNVANVGVRVQIPMVALKGEQMFYWFGMISGLIVHLGFIFEMICILQDRIYQNWWFAGAALVTSASCFARWWYRIPPIWGKNYCWIHDGRIQGAAWILIAAYTLCPWFQYSPRF